MRAADLKGYQYSRDDVDARSLANSYAQMLGNIFTHEMKPMEVEILVAEVGLDPAGDQMFHILYDGTVVDQRDIAAIGGDAETIKGRLDETWTEGLSLRRGDQARRRRAVGRRSGDPAGDLEVAELARTNGRRCFHRLAIGELEAALA